jgi:hypothetical protein
MELKRLIVLLIVLSSLLACAACGDNPAAPSENFRAKVAPVPVVRSL